MSYVVRIQTSPIADDVDVDRLRLGALFGIGGATLPVLDLRS